MTDSSSKALDINRIMDQARKALTLIAAVTAAILAIINGQPNPNVPPPNNPPTIPTSPRPGDDPRPDPAAAIGKIQFGSAGCTATIIGPRRSDGRWDILTAAHCLKGQPDTGRMQLKSGQVLTVKRAAMDTESDAAWLVTVDSHQSLPFALLADRNPEVESAVWHMGYGYDQPGNREDGKVVNPLNSMGQTQFWLSVSSGDSGGGIILNESGRVVSSVCCTQGMARKSNVWGTSAERAKAIRPGVQADKFEWTPIKIPIME